MRFRIAGIRRYDGEYEFDPQRKFNALEWRWVKKYAGYFPLTMQEGIRVGDQDLDLTLGLIAIHRSGKLDPADADALFEEMSFHASDELITVLDDGEQGDEEPTPLATEPDTQ